MRHWLPALMLLATRTDGHIAIARPGAPLLARGTRCGDGGEVRRRAAWMGARFHSSAALELYSSRKAPSLSRGAGPGPRMDSEMDGVQRGNGYQVEQNLNVELTDAKAFSQLKLVSVGLSFGCAMQVLNGEGVASWVHLTTLWWLTSRVGKVLQNAARRGRLGASTFQILNLGIIIALACNVVVASQAGGFLGALLSHIFLVLPSAHALRRYGPPRLSSLLPETETLCNGLSLSYALLALHTAARLFGVLAGKLTPVSHGSCLQLVPAAALLALRSAAIAGPKRLSSSTYLDLNRALRTYALGGAIADFSALARGAQALSASFCFNFGAQLALAYVCTAGFRRGASYSEDATSDSQQAVVIDVKVVQSD
mmetsp:Transcript_31230/g.71754  ORF Transcript_31230/g.71754 Transcript_31230/m.71754 type:complete len:369 (-) Transcript_31230:61-1167(-)